MGNKTGEKYIAYITSLVKSQMKIDELGIKSDGNLCFCVGGKWIFEGDVKKYLEYTLMPEFIAEETISSDEMEKRIENLVLEIMEQ